MSDSRSSAMGVYLRGGAVGRPSCVGNAKGAGLKAGVIRAKALKGGDFTRCAKALNLSSF
jgi:hypothetical protein